MATGSLLNNVVITSKTPQINQNTRTHRVRASGVTCIIGAWLTRSRDDSPTFRMLRTAVRGPVEM